MKIELVISQKLEKDLSLKYEEDIHDVIDLCFEISKVFSYYEKDIKFIISGFGIGNWPVSLQVDFEVFLEQLPDLILWLFSIELHKENFILSFYEQGIERDVKFSIQQDKLNAICYFYDGKYVNEYMSLDAFKKNIKLFFDELTLGIRKLMPNLIERKIVSDWLLSMKNTIES